MLKTILITGSIGMVVGFAGTLLTMFGGGSIRVEYLEFVGALDSSGQRRSRSSSVASRILTAALRSPPSAV